MFFIFIKFKIEYFTFFFNLFDPNTATCESPPNPLIDLKLMVLQIICINN
jgi:hypothetical protein